jgi:uncharacterized protein (DUF433 family)
MLTLAADPVPIREEADGALRVGGTRVLLELVIDAFEDGATPESIIQRYPTLTLADTYSVISYYLRHRDEVAGYLGRRREKAGEVARKIEAAGRDLSDIRRRLLSARTPSGPDHAAAGG